MGGLPSEKGTKPLLFKMRSGSEYHLSGMKSSGRTKHSFARRKLDTYEPAIALSGSTHIDLGCTVVHLC